MNIYKRKKLNNFYNLSIRFLQYKKAVFFATSRREEVLKKVSGLNSVYRLVY